MQKHKDSTLLAYTLHPQKWSLREFDADMLKSIQKGNRGSMIKSDKYFPTAGGAMHKICKIIVSTVICLYVEC